VTLVPVVNEPALARCDRAADDGLDLARTCPGRADGSITEQIADALSKLIRTADFYIDLHTGGTRWSVAPLAGYVLHPVPQVLDCQRRMARAFNLPIIWGTDYRLEGRSLSVARDANVPAIYTEYLGAASCDPAGVAAYVDGCLDVMGELGMLDRPARASHVEHIVEDPRPSSGHMQLCNPSPLDGYFEPAIKLGQTIRQGEPIGTVCDTLGEVVREVVSQQNGIVGGLRTFPHVAVGDALAVIIDTNYLVARG
jgi:predicted deacylase